MKIYMVIGDNLESAYEDYKEWNEAAFASKKSAEDYIRKLTDDENAEYEKLIRDRLGAVWNPHENNSCILYEEPSPLVLSWKHLEGNDFKITICY